MLHSATRASTGLLKHFPGPVHRLSSKAARQLDQYKLRDQSQPPFHDYLSIVTWWRDLIKKADGENFKQELAYAVSETITWGQAGKVPWWESLSILHLCTKLGVKSSRLVNHLCANIIKGTQGSIAALDPTQAAKLIYSLGVLKQRALQNRGQDEDKPVPAEKLFVEALNHVVHRMGLEKVNILGLSSIAYGVGKWGSTSTEEISSVARSLAYECVQADRLNAYSEQGLSNVIYSLGLMREKRVDVFSALVKEACKKERLRRFNEQHFSNIVFGLGLVQFDRRIKLKPLLDWVMQPEQLRAFKTQGLCNFLHGLAQMNYRDSKIFSPMLEEGVRRSRNGDMTPFQLGCFIQACGCIENLPPDVRASLIEVVPQSGQLSKMNARSLSNVACALSKLQMQDANKWRAVYAGCCCVLNGLHCGPKEAGALCWAMGSSGFYCAKLLETLLHRIMKSPQHQSPQLELKTLSQGLYACRRYHHHNPHFMEFVREVMDARSELTDWDLLDFAWSACYLEHFSPRTFLWLCKRMQTAKSFTPAHVHDGTFFERVTMIDSYVRIRFKDLGTDTVQKLGFRSNRYKELERSRLRARRSFKKPSRLRLQIHTKLVGMGFPCEVDIWVDDCLVDLRIGDHLVIIADEDAHYFDLQLEQKKLWGPLSHQIKMLQHLGKQVSCIQSSVWGRLTSQEQSQLLKDLLGSSQGESKPEEFIQSQ